MCKLDRDLVVRVPVTYLPIGFTVWQNAKDHFPVHFERYFDDDRAVMRLKPRDSSEVLDIIEPWKVASGDHVLHTRKVNLEDRYMLGTFIKADEVHLGKVSSGIISFL